MFPPSLKQLAQQTLVRDALFTPHQSALISLIEGKEDCYLPEDVSAEVLVQLCETWCKPRELSEGAKVLIHNAATEVTLSNISHQGGHSPQLYELFSRCLNLQQIHLSGVSLWPGFFPTLRPTCPTITHLSFSCCRSITDIDISSVILECCPRLVSLNLAHCQITDDAFVMVQPARVQCGECGCYGNKRLILEDLDLTGCMKITSRAVRKLVELCGPSLRRLILNQCVDIYCTALWYLTGIFQGKEKFLDEDFEVPEPLSCCCDIDIAHRHAHWQATRKGKAYQEEQESPCPPLPRLLHYLSELLEGQSGFLISFLSHTTSEEEVAGPSSSTAVTPTVKTPVTEEDFDKKESCLHVCRLRLRTLLEGLVGDCAKSCRELGAIINQDYDDINIDHHRSFRTVSSAISVNIDGVRGVLESLVAIDYTSAGGEDVSPGPLLGRVLEYKSALERVMVEIARNELLRLQLRHSLQLEALQRDELDRMKEMHGHLSEFSNDLIAEMDQQEREQEQEQGQEQEIEEQDHEEPDMGQIQNQEDRGDHDQVSDITPATEEPTNEEHPSSIIQDLEEPGVSAADNGELNQTGSGTTADTTLTAESFVTGSHLDSAPHSSQSTSSDLIQDKSLDSTTSSTSTEYHSAEEDISEDHVTPIATTPTEHDVGPLVQENVDVQHNVGPLTQDVADIQHNVGPLAQDLSDIQLVEDNIVENDQAGIVQIDEDAGPARVFELRGEDIVPNLLDEREEDIYQDEVIPVRPPSPQIEIRGTEEDTPELVTLLKSEVSLLLQHGKYTHCPSCCPYAYTPKIEELALCNTKYQTEILARTLLKGFVAVNKGLRSISLSWPCLDNDTVEFIAKTCPGLESLTLEQATGLQSPLVYFSRHNLTELNTMGTWIYDVDILRCVNSNLTRVCVAESYITDISLRLLALRGKLVELNLNWCDNITDSGIAAVVTAHSASLQTLLVRQCAYGTKTLNAIAKCSKLRVLDLSQITEITEAAWNTFAVSLPLLENLDMSWMFGVKDPHLSLLLAHCPRLKKLNIDGHKQITTKCFRKMMVALPVSLGERNVSNRPISPS
eukprot:sb/3461460/